MITWKIPQFIALTKAQVVKGFNRAGIYLTSALRKSLNRSQKYKRSASGTGYKGFDPSKPGQYPKKLSGQLMKSITWSVDTSAMTLTVGSNLSGYPSFLQTGTRTMGARPWLTLGWDKDKGTIGKMIVSGK